ncbi:MAG: hypothetical protein H7Y88_04945 [Phycisphaerales bacterium]|nr:hypothetical protein [Phycisphaerales bacterium]
MTGLIIAGRRVAAGAVRFAMLAALVSLLAGCSRTIIEDRLATGYDPADVEQDLGFWHSLPGRAAVANDEGLHGLILLESGADELATYGARVAHAREKGWVSESWDEEAGFAMQRGLAARALVKICEIEGGVVMRVFGPSERSSLREIVYLGLMPPSTENQTMTGEEFMGIIAKAEDYVRMRDYERAEDAKKAAPDAAEPPQGEAAEPEENATSSGPA